MADVCSHLDWHPTRHTVRERTSDIGPILGIMDHEKIHVRVITWSLL